jgi:hypothetical protein
MQYIVLMEFIAGNPQIWVAKINPTDPEYIYDTEQEAADKAAELQAADPTGRQYKAAPLADI